MEFEHEKRFKLEEMVEQLAKDQVSLESQAKRSMHKNISVNAAGGKISSNENKNLNLLIE